MEALKKRLLLLRLYPEEPCLRRAEALLHEVFMPDDIRQQFLDTDSLIDLLAAMLFWILSQPKPQKGPEMWMIERLEARIKAVTGER